MDKKFTVSIEDCGTSFQCDGAKDLLRSMEVLGRRGIPVGCRGGGCGVCKVQITEGQYHTRKMSRAYLSAEEEAQGIVLACKCFPDSDMRVKVVGKMVKAWGGTAR